MTRTVMSGFVGASPHLISMASFLGLPANFAAALETSNRGRALSSAVRTNPCLVEAFR